MTIQSLNWGFLNRPLGCPGIARKRPASESPRLGTLAASQRGLCNAVQGLPGAIRPLFWSSTPS